MAEQPIFCQCYKSQKEPNLPCPHKALKGSQYCGVHTRSGCKALQTQHGSLQQIKEPVVLRTKHEPSAILPQTELLDLSNDMIHDVCETMLQQHQYQDFVDFMKTGRRNHDACKDLIPQAKESFRVMRYRRASLMTQLSQATLKGYAQSGREPQGPNLFAMRKIKKNMTPNQLMELIASKPEYQIDDDVFNGDALIHQLVMMGSIILVTALVEQHPWGHKLLELCNMLYHTPLFLAIEKNDLPMARELVRLGAPLGLVCPIGNRGRWELEKYQWVSPLAQVLQKIQEMKGYESDPNLSETYHQWKDFAKELEAMKAPNYNIKNEVPPL